MIRAGNNFIDTCWYQDGKLKSWSHSSSPECRNDMEWYRTRQLRYYSKCDGDTNTYLEFYSTGQLKNKSLTYIDSTNGKGNSFAWHYTEEYYENGQLKFLPMDPNSQKLQQQVRFYESGAKMDSVGWLNGTRVGFLKEWHEGGQIKTVREYVVPSNDGYLHDSKKIGTWSYYNESGKLIKEEYYEEGKLVKTIEH